MSRKKNISGYNVYLACDGNDPEFLGYVASLRGARKLAATGCSLPKYLWQTARAAGHCGGLSAPEGDEAEEPSAWFGRGGNYCAVAVFAPERTVAGCQIQHDNSGVGHNWRNIDRADIPADVVTQIECEIIDGGREQCDDFVGGGQHFRWS